MKQLVFLRRLIVLAFLPWTLPLGAQGAQNTPWDGLKFTGYAGGYGVFRSVFEEDRHRIGPCVEGSLEYGKSFGAEKKFYFGADLVFNAFFPDSFEKKNITLFGGERLVYSVLYPTFDFFLGYNVSEKTQILLGSTYFWGATVVARHFVSERVFVSIRAVAWLDRVFFKQGLHDGYLLLGIGFVF